MAPGWLDNGTDNVPMWHESAPVHGHNPREGLACRNHHAYGISVHDGP